MEHRESLRGRMNSHLGGSGGRPPRKVLACRSSEIDSDTVT